MDLDLFPLALTTLYSWAVKSSMNSLNELLWARSDLTTILTTLIVTSKTEADLPPIFYD